MLGPCRAAASLFVCTSQRLLLPLLLLLVLLSLRVPLHQQQSGCRQRHKHGCESRQEPAGPAHRLPGRHRRDLGHRLVSPPLPFAPSPLSPPLCAPPPWVWFLRMREHLHPRRHRCELQKSGSGSAHGGDYLRGRTREAAGWGVGGGVNADRRVSPAEPNRRVSATLDASGHRGPLCFRFFRSHLEPISGFYVMRCSGVCARACACAACASVRLQQSFMGLIQRY